MLVLLYWRIACSGAVSEPKSRSGLGLSEAEEAEEEVDGRVTVVTVWHGKTLHFIGPCI